MVPEDPTDESIKPVLALLDRCPECGGQGFTVTGTYDSPPEQEPCGHCFCATDLFWKDSIGYRAVMLAYELHVPFRKTTASDMRFKVEYVPKGSALKIGDVLTLEQAAQLLELSTQDMADRSREAAHLCRDGYTFRILPSRIERDTR